MILCFVEGGPEDKYTIKTNIHCTYDLLSDRAFLGSVCDSSPHSPRLKVIP